MKIHYQSESTIATIRMDDGKANAMVRAGHLKNLNLHAYRTSKKRLCTAEVERVLELLKNELPFADV